MGFALFLGAGLPPAGSASAQEALDWSGEFTFTDPNTAARMRLETTTRFEFQVDRSGRVVGGTVRIIDSTDGQVATEGALSGSFEPSIDVSSTMEPPGVRAFVDAQLLRLMQAELKLRADPAAAAYVGDQMKVQGEGALAISEPNCIQALFARGEGSGDCPRVDLTLDWQASGPALAPPRAAAGARETKSGETKAGERLPISDDEFHRLMITALMMALAAMLGGAAGSALGAAMAALGSGRPWWEAVADAGDPGVLTRDPPRPSWLNITGETLNQDASAAARLYRRADGSLDLDAMARFFDDSYGLPPGGERPSWMSEEDFAAAQALRDQALERAAMINLMDSRGELLPPQLFGLFGPDLPALAPADTPDAPDLPPLPPGHVAYDATHRARLAAMLGDGVTDARHHGWIGDLMARIERDGSLSEDELEAIEREHAQLAAAVRDRADAFVHDPEAEARQQARTQANRDAAAAEMAEVERRKDEQARAAETLEAIRRAAERTGQTGIYERALYLSDGSLDPDQVARLKAALYRQLGRDVAAPDASLENTSLGNVAFEAADKTIGDAGKSLIARAGLGYLSGGVSELLFQGHSGLHKLQDAVNAAADRGDDLTGAEFGKLWVRHMIDENLPVNTLNALARARERQFAGEDSSVGLGELGMALVADVFAGKEVMDSGGGLLAGRFLDDTMDAASASGLRQAAADAAQPVSNLIQRGQDAYTAAGTRLGFDMNPAPPGRLSAEGALQRYKDNALADGTRDIIRDVQGSRSTWKEDLAFERGRAEGLKKVAEFDRAAANVDAAVKRGADADEVAKLQQRLRDLVAEVQGDKHAMNQLNRLPRTEGQPHPGIERFNTEMQEIYRRADEATIRRLAAQYRVNPSDIRPVEITNIKGRPDSSLGTRPEAADHMGLASRKTADGSVDPGTSRGARGELHAQRAPDKAPSKESASMDRDLTMRVRSIENGVEVWRDIPSTTTARHYNEELYKAFTGKEPGPRAAGPGHRPESVDFKDTHLTGKEATGPVSDITNPDIFAKRMDQATTDRLHPEAYGGGKMDLDTATKDTHRGRDLRDVGAAARTMEYKVHHWQKEAEGLNGAAAELRTRADSLEAQAKSADPAEALQAREAAAQARSEAGVYEAHAQAMTEEAQRQLHKQFQNMVAVRTGAMQAVGNAPGATIPHSLSEGVNVLGAVKRGELTPAQAEAVLSRMGTSTEQLAHQMSAYVEALQNVRPSASKSVPPIISVRGWDNELRRPPEEDHARQL